MSNIQIYILTHKKFNEKYDSEIYTPILNGSANLKNDFNYLRDDTGDNISTLNPYYAELTGQYWVWKNSKADIIGFCHYRRYFANNLLLNKINKKEIEKTLENYDIIMPQIRHLNMPIYEESTRNFFNEQNVLRKEDYKLLRLIIKEKYPEYIKSYDEVIHGKQFYWFNMFIAKKEFVNNYFTWLFDILEEFRNKHDFSIYEGGVFRILGYLSERLLTTYLKKNNLKIKEKYLIQPELPSSYFSIISHRFPFIFNISNHIIRLKNKKK